MHNLSSATSILHEPDSIELLGRIPLFDKFNHRELQIVMRFLHQIQYAPGDIVFTEGERGDFICFVVAGMVDVIKRSEDGTLATIATLGRGRTIGEMALIDEYPRSATVRALVPTILLILSIRQFNLIAQEFPALGLKMLRSIARMVSMNLRKTSSHLVDLMV